VNLLFQVPFALFLQIKDEVHLKRKSLEWSNNCKKLGLTCVAKRHDAVLIHHCVQGKHQHQQSTDYRLTGLTVFTATQVEAIDFWATATISKKMFERTLGPFEKSC